MKKFLFMLCLGVISITLANAQLIKQPFVNQDVGTITTLSSVVPFCNSYTSYGTDGQWLIAQIDYTGCVGDSCRVKFYVSAGNVWTGITTVLNASSLVKAAATNTSWKTGQGYGTAVTKYEMINITNYPTGYVKALIDTTTGMTSGKVTVTIKPYGKIYSMYDLAKSNLIYTPIVNYSIGAKTAKSVTFGFCPDACVDKVLLQIDYIGMSGRAVDVRLFASGTTTFTDTTRLNSSSNCKWTTGANITKWDTIDIRSIPVAYLKVNLQYAVAATTGYVTVSVKPIFK